MKNAMEVQGKTAILETLGLFIKGAEQASCDKNLSNVLEFESVEYLECNTIFYRLFLSTI